MPARPALLLFFATCCLLAAPAWARVIQVGPGELVTTVAEAARLARDDDVVEIAPGTYRADVAVWLQKRLTIRGVGQRPVLDAAGRNAEGQARPDNSLNLVHNTFYSAGLRPAWFLHVFGDKFASPPVVTTRNNVLASVGIFSAGVAGDHAGNAFAPTTPLQPWAPGAVQRLK